MRDIYEIRERSSRMYRWSALATAQVAIELPWNILASTLFLRWYWTVGFEIPAQDSHILCTAFASRFITRPLH
jgi:ABC-type multidrug transport system permease subunit